MAEVRKRTRGRSFNMEIPPATEPAVSQEELASKAAAQQANVSKARERRRRRSFDQLGSNSALKSAFSDAMGSFAAEIDENADPIKKVEFLLTKAKEGGMTCNQIFGFFQGPSASKDITPESLQEALMSINPGKLSFTDAEMSLIVEKFDYNKDGTIDIREFMNFAYNIQAVAWKAERTRLEAKGQVVVLERPTSEGPATDDGAGAATQPAGSGSDVGMKFYKGSKLFWKTNETVEMEMYYHEGLNIITIASYNQTAKDHYTPLFVDTSVVPDPRERSRSLDGKHSPPPTIRRRTSSAISPEEVVKKSLQEKYAEYLMQRMKIYEPGKPLPTGYELPMMSRQLYIAKLSTDTFERIAVAKPAAFGEVPHVKIPRRASFEDFNKLTKELSQMAAESSERAKNAGKMSRLLRRSMHALETLKGQQGSLTRLAHEGNVDALSALVLRRFAFKLHCEYITENLKKSPAYAELLNEQSRRRAAAGEAENVTLPPI